MQRQNDISAQCAFMKPIDRSWKSDANDYDTEEIFIELRNKEIHITKQTHLRERRVTRSGSYEYISEVLGSHLEGQPTMARFHHILVGVEYFVPGLKLYRFR